MPTLTTRQMHTRTLRVLRAVVYTFGDEMDAALREQIEQVITIHGKALWEDGKRLDKIKKT